MAEAVVVMPEGLDEMAPGPDLAAVLATIDPTRLNGSQLVDLLCVRNRQLAWEQAQLLLVIRELAYAPFAGPLAPPRRSDDWDLYAAKEIAFALSWTDRAAETHLCLAMDATEKLPAVFEALAAGRIDLARAKVICDELEDLDAEHARTIVARVLSEPGEIRATTGRLRQQIHRLIAQADPDAATKRRQKSLDNRHVEHNTYANGTAALAGSYLDKAKAAAAWDNLHRIATATKATGDERSLDQIRADAFCDLLAGVDPSLAGAATPAPRRGTVNLHVELATLAALNEHAAELEGFGPVTADIARQIADAQRDSAVWRFTVTDNGRVLHEGRLHYRPTAAQTAYVRARDITCRAPGCRQPAMRCDIDHIRDWDLGGLTEEFNLCLLCKRHHKAKHEGGFQLRRTDYGVLWITPRGKAYPVAWGRDLNYQQRQLIQRIVDQQITINPRR